MGVAKPLTIGERVFARQMDALAFYKDMLNRYSIGERISDFDQRDLDSLLQRHNDPDSKRGVGVSHFEVRSDGYGGRCFWVVRSDGTAIDFTYVGCVTGRW